MTRAADTFPTEGTAITVPSYTEFVSDGTNGNFTNAWMYVLLIHNGILRGMIRFRTGIHGKRESQYVVEVWEIYLKVD